MTSVFISYRRRDSALAARWLAETIGRRFGPDAVFIDTDGIRGGDAWSARIEAELRSAKILIAVIGAQWLRTSDEFGRRRLDIEEDWVRREIIHAITNRYTIIPLLVSGGELPPGSALPEALAQLVASQAITLRDDHWPGDVKAVLEILQRRGLTPVTADPEYPLPHIRGRALSDGELDEALRRLEGWTRVIRAGDDLPVTRRCELTRTFRFGSFEDAMHFMMTATRYITKAEHHPDWRNLWRSVTVWLTTWDIGHQPTFRDVELASYLNELYTAYRPVDG